MRLLGELGELYGDEQFVELFSEWSQPAEAPRQLVLVMAMQFAEVPADRQYKPPMQFTAGLIEVKISYTVSKFRLPDSSELFMTVLPSS